MAVIVVRLFRLVFQKLATTILENYINNKSKASRWGDDSGESLLSLLPPSCMVAPERDLVNTVGWGMISQDDKPIHILFLFHIPISYFLYFEHGPTQSIVSQCLGHNIIASFSLTTILYGSTYKRISKYIAFHFIYYFTTSTNALWTKTLRVG